MNPALGRMWFSMTGSNVAFWPNPVGAAALRNVGYLELPPTCGATRMGANRTVQLGDWLEQQISN